MIILGVDPGTATTGFGVVEKTSNLKFRLLDFGIISTEKTLSAGQRLVTLKTDLQKIIQKYHPNLGGIEKIFFTSNQKTAVAVSQARGVILETLISAFIPIKEFTPLQVKNMMCGYGKADKKQVQIAVKRELKLPNLPNQDDAADALAIAICAGINFSGLDKLIK